MGNGSRVLTHGVGTVNLFPFLFIDNVPYVSGSLFNLLSISHLTRSLDCYFLYPNFYLFIGLEFETGDWHRI